MFWLFELTIEWWHRVIEMQLEDQLDGLWRIATHGFALFMFYSSIRLTFGSWGEKFVEDLLKLPSVRLR